MIQIGLTFASTRGIKLNMKGKDPDMVGLGSYLVNVAGDCNGCHTKDPTTEYTVPGNPYFLKPPFTGVTQINPATYLGGGSDFGPFPTTTGTVDIVSRNLTPDITGLPEGGHSLSDFKQIIRTGVDLDKAASQHGPSIRRYVAPSDALAELPEHDGSAAYRNLDFLKRDSLHRHSGRGPTAITQQLP
jgi:hypothetical protein